MHIGIQEGKVFWEHDHVCLDMMANAPAHMGGKWQFQLDISDSFKEYNLRRVTVVCLNMLGQHEFAGNLEEMWGLGEEPPDLDVMNATVISPLNFAGYKFSELVNMFHLDISSLEILPEFRESVVQQFSEDLDNPDWDSLLKGESDE